MLEKNTQWFLCKAYISTELQGNVLVPSSLCRYNQSLLGRRALIVSPCHLQLCCSKLILANWVNRTEIGFQEYDANSRPNSDLTRTS